MFLVAREAWLLAGCHWLSALDGGTSLSGGVGHRADGGAAGGRRLHGSGRQVMRTELEVCR